MTQEYDTEAGEGMPFAHEKIDVCDGIDGFRAFAERYPGFTFCPYLADKTDDGWAQSTSRVYMNQIIPRFLYVPVNIGKGREGDLAAFFDGVANDPRVVAVNITQPHKSNLVVMAMFAAEQNGIENIDTLMRGEDGAMHPYDRDAPAFIGWYNQVVGSFTGANVVMVGAGGAGTPIAQLVARQRPSQMVVVDPSDKSRLVAQLQRDTTVLYTPSLEHITPEWLSGKLMVINAAGKAGMSPSLAKLLGDHSSPENVFVDIRPQLKIESVETAEGLGWKAYTGHGMNAHNDHALACAIAERMGVPAPSFEEFRELVAKAS